MAPVIETRGLVKRYDGELAVAGIDLVVESGEIYGLVGPNGAGKTTTMRILATLLAPSAGEARVCGIGVTEDPIEVRRRIGYMPDFYGVYDDLRVWEYLDFFARCYGVTAGRRATMIGELLEIVGLTDKRQAYVETLSRGMRQRLCLAHTLVHDPDLLILDEPASGLERATSLLGNQPGVGQVYPVNGDLEVEFLGDENAAADLLSALVSGGVRVASFSETISDLEEIFLRLTKGEVA